MAVPTLKSVTFGIGVSDLDASRTWYKILLGIDPEVDFEQGIVEFRLLPDTYLQLSQASEQPPTTTGKHQPAGGGS